MLRNIFEDVYVIFEMNTVELEIKESSMIAISSILAECVHFLEDFVPGVLETLLSRISNEVTRVPALKSIIILTQSSSQVRIQPILERLVMEMLKLMKKSNTLLKMDAANALKSTIKHARNELTFGSIDLIINESISCIS
jgi:hypothetical protein